MLQSGDFKFMNLIGLIKEKLTSSVIEKISVFLGESSDNISIALNQVLPTILGVIIEATTEENTGMLMDVLKDGGHTGDILNDLPDLFASPDKTQLMITVGTNIIHHFYGGKIHGIADTIASLSDIRKTSAASLVGLASPLVLGALGKVVDTEGLGVSGLKRLLNEESENVMVAIPPILINKLVAKEDTSVNKSAKIKARRIPNSDEAQPSRIIMWTLMLILVLALAAGVVYMFKYREQKAILQQTGLLPIVDSGVTFKNDTLTKVGMTDSAKLVLPEKTVKTDSFSNSASIPPNGSSLVASAFLLSEELNHNTGWIPLPKLSFDTGSAEVRYAGGVNDIVRFLRNNPMAGITIAGGKRSINDSLGEYRSYALRELLIERGIEQRRIIIQPNIENNVDSQVTIRISK